MAGLGLRFSEKGYILPKPLISASGNPIIINVIRNMPKSDKWIFAVREEHIKKFGIDKVIRSEIKNAIIIPVNKTTEGQACTCLLAKKYLDPNEPLFIASCDATYLYDEKKYNEYINKKDVDCILWTFTNRDNLKQNPNAWGWCKVDKDKMTITDMSVKIPISTNPYNDHAVAGIFYFKKSKDFIDSAEAMIKENYRINNEFYVDAIPIFLKKVNKKSIIFDVKLYVSFGSPKDFEYYNLLDYVYRFNGSKKLLNKEDQKGINSWKEYFDKIYKK
jgi:dTDP-glucose pyrophosphorylase